MWHIFSIDPAWAIGGAVLLGLGVGRFLAKWAYCLPLSMERDWLLQIQTYLDQDVTVPPVASDRELGRSGRQAHSVVIPILTSGLFGLCAWRFGASIVAICAMGFCAALITLSWIDARTRLLPDVITLPLLWAGLLINLNDVFTSLPMAVLGAAVGYLSLWVLFHFFRFLTGQEGMGYGDFKLVAAMGAWFGLAALPFLVLVSSFAGVLGALVMYRSRHVDKGITLPFGPYLALSGVLALFFPMSWVGMWV